MTAPKTPARILVTDDDDGVRNALARFLTRLGYDVIQADSGAAALEILAHGHFSAMLCDIRMPGMTGVELLPKVIAQDGDIAVIMLTAVGEPGSAIQCLKLGATDYLIKPVELDELAHALQYALRKRELEIERRQMEQWLAREVAEKTKELNEQARQVELLSLSILMALVDAAEPPGAGGRNHSMRVANLSAHVASELGHGQEQIEIVRLAARIHDLGKLAALGDRAPNILEPLRRYAEVAAIIRGQGIGSKIIAVANRFDELTDGGERRSSADAMAEIRAGKGSAYDPAAVDALQAVVDRRAH